VLLLAALLIVQTKAAVEERLTLDNGLEVVLKPVDGPEVAAVVVAYRAGVAHEPAERHGIAHLVEHLVVRGATASFKAGEAEKAQIAAGPFGQQFMDANAETLHDFTYLYSVCRADKLEQALKIEGERMRGCLFTQELLDAERARALEEVATVAKSAPAQAYNRALALTYSTSRYRLPKVGSEGPMKAATLDDARAFYDAWYRPNNAALIVYGAVEPKKAKEWIATHFGGHAKAVLPAVEAPEEPDEKGERAEFTGSPRQVMVTWLSPENGTKEKAAIMVAVYRLLRARGAIHDLSQQAFFFDDPYLRGRSMITLSAVLKEKSDPAEAATAAQAWIDGFTLDEASLDEARTNLRNDLTSNDTFQVSLIPKREEKKIAQALAQIAINRARVEVAGAGRAADLLKAADALTVAEVMAAVKSRLSKERANVVIVK
jgi:predicted Zn-dependent peptidase